MIKQLLKSRKPVAIGLAVTMSAISLPLMPANAALVGTENVIAQKETSLKRSEISSFLAREDVRGQLQAMGISPEEAQMRVASLSDEEIQAFADRIDTMPAGQGALGTIAVVALVGFLVLLITDLLGYTHVFGFTNKGSMQTN